MKTVEILEKKNIAAELADCKMKEAFQLVCDIRDGVKEAKALSANAESVHALQCQADKFIDLGNAIAEAVKHAEGAYYSETGTVTEGFMLKNNGETKTITDFARFVNEAEKNGANMGELAKYATISAKNAAKWLGMSDEAFLLTYEEFVKRTPKAASLQREY